VGDLDKILEACVSNGVQFLDGSMWLHHPRTMKMKELLFDFNHVGQVDFVSCVLVFISFFFLGHQFLKENALEIPLFSYKICDFSQQV
jgi:hypothetical protein